MIFPASFPLCNGLSGKIASSFSLEHTKRPRILSSCLNMANGSRKARRCAFHSKCNAVFKSYKHEFMDKESSLTEVTESSEALPFHEEMEVSSPMKNTSQDPIEAIKKIFYSMSDGEINVSAYDTAWVALVADIHGSGDPQFPSALQWIIKNQLPDGSWGDSQIFSAHDRLLNTLACVIALKSWKMCPRQCQNGLLFLWKNLDKLKDENAEHMCIGFEVTFPSLLEIARSLKLDLPYSSSVLQDIYEKQKLKLERIPKEILHSIPTTLLHSLEGMPDLDWDKLLDLRCSDGSLLFSPSSTAFALMQTRDIKCLQYLKKVVRRFHGGAPNVYPVDMFERIWAVDRLDRLGVSRYFELEIRECLNYVYRNWSEDGICWARNTNVQDVDDTAMGFRLLRLHGYKVSADVFWKFEKDGEFFCFPLQTTQAVTGMFNLYRASQVSFHGEKILEDAGTYSTNFLRERQASNQLVDKWVISKNLPGEVGYALDFPWFSNLPRIESRFYIEHYGGRHDVWIGKTLYRMPHVSNDLYLNFAIEDFNRCQSLHQREWIVIKKWCTKKNLVVSQSKALKAYFLAAACIFEPERATERLAWAHTAILIEAISSYFYKHRNASQILDSFLQRWDSTENIRDKKGDALVETLEYLAGEVQLVHGLDVRNQLKYLWRTWLQRWHGEERNSNDPHQFHRPDEAEFLVHAIEVCAGRGIPHELLSHPQYILLANLTNEVCRYLHFMSDFNVQGELSNFKNSIELSVDAKMREIAEIVLVNSDGFDSKTKHVFLFVAKSYYYTAHCSEGIIDHHISKLFKVH